MTLSKSVIKRWRVLLGKDPVPPEWEDDGDRSWIKEEVPGKGNGIGPVCKYCLNLIDWNPVDHSPDCTRPNKG